MRGHARRRRADQGPRAGARLRAIHAARPPGAARPARRPRAPVAPAARRLRLRPAGRARRAVPRPRAAPRGAMTALRLRTAAWYGDEEIELGVPDGWDVTVHTPQTPPPLSDDAIEAALRTPVAQEPASRLAAGARRPLIIVDDLTRPTPADRIVPAPLRQLAEAGVAAGDVTILLATGTHQDTPPDAVARKVGPEAAAACRPPVPPGPRAAPP